MTIAGLECKNEEHREYDNVGLECKNEKHTAYDNYGVRMYKWRTHVTWQLWD